MSPADEIWPHPNDLEAGGKPRFVQLIVEVPDVEACLLDAARLGTRFIGPKTTLPDGDTMAVLFDPTGPPFVVCRPKSITT